MNGPGGRPDDRYVEQAAAWHARIDAPDMDWDAFAAWLEADPAHQATYDRVAMIDDEVSRWAIASGVSMPPAVSPAANDDHRRARRWIGGGAVAAALVAAVSLPTLLHTSIAPKLYETGRAAGQTVALGDGNRVQLDRSTRLAVASGKEDRVRLESGAAYFQIRHDPSRTFVVQSGAVTITDIGTRFTVTRQGDHTIVAVEDGIVGVALPGGATTRIKAGQTVDVAEQGAPAPVRPIDPATVGSWRSGRLIYDDAPLRTVAADASRYAGKAITVDPDIADLRLSGILIIGDGSHLVDQIQAYLPVSVRVEGDHLRLVRVARRR